MILISSFQEKSIGYNNWGYKATYGWLHKFSSKYIHTVSSIFWQSPGFEAQLIKLVISNGNSHLGAISQCERGQ